MSDTLFFFYLGLLFLQVQFLQRLLVSKWAVPSQNKLQYEPDLMLVVFLASSSCVLSSFSPLCNLLAFSATESVSYLEC